MVQNKIDRPIFLGMSLLVLISGFGITLCTSSASREIPLLCDILQKCAKWERDYVNAKKLGDPISASFDQIFQKADSNQLQEAINTLSDAISQLQTIPPQAKNKDYYSHVENRLKKYQSMQASLQAELDLENLTKQIPSNSTSNSDITQVTIIRDQIQYQVSFLKSQDLPNKNDLLERYQELLATLNDRITYLQAKTNLDSLKKKLVASKNPTDLTHEIPSLKKQISSLESIESVSPVFSEVQKTLKSYRSLLEDTEAFFPFWQAIEERNWDQARTYLGNLDQNSSFAKQIETLEPKIPPLPTPQPAIVTNNDNDPITSIDPGSNGGSNSTSSTSSSSGNSTNNSPSSPPPVDEPPARPSIPYVPEGANVKE